MASWRSLLLGDRGAAEDITQDALVEVYRRWVTFQTRAHAATYARTCVVNSARDALRRRSVALRAQHRLIARERSAEPGVQHHLVIQALRKLPDRQREVVVLRYWLDLPEADIATTLGISPGTVKSTASRAMTTLRQHLEDTK